MTPHPIFALALGLWASIQGPPEGYVSLWDLDRFPDEETCRELCNFSQAHKDWLKSRPCLDLVNQFEWCEWFREADERHDAWWELLVSHSKSNRAPERRNHLRRLRRMIGHDWYEQGRMPHIIPYHRFSRMD